LAGLPLSGGVMLAAYYAACLKAAYLVYSSSAGFIAGSNLFFFSSDLDSISIDYLTQSGHYLFFKQFKW